MAWTRLGAPSNDDLYVLSRLIDEGRSRRTVATEPLSVDRQDGVALGDVCTGLDEWACRRRFPTISLHDVANAPHVGGRVEIEVGSEPAHLPLRWLAPIASNLVRVTRPEFALHLPEQIRQFGTSRYTLDKWQVQVEDSRPVDPQESRIPKVVALEPPRFFEHLPPLRARVHLDAYSAEVQRPALSPWVIADRRPQAVSCRGPSARSPLASRTTSVEPSLATEKS